MHVNIIMLDLIGTGFRETLTGIKKIFHADVVGEIAANVATPLFLDLNEENKLKILGEK